MEKIYFKADTHIIRAMGIDEDVVFYGYCDSQEIFDEFKKEAEHEGGFFGKCPNLRDYLYEGVCILDAEEDDTYSDFEVLSIKNEISIISKQKYYNKSGWPEKLNENGLTTRKLDVSDQNQKAEWLDLRKGLITSSSVCSCIQELFYNPQSGAEEFDEEPEYLQGHIMTPYAYYHALRGNYEPPEMKKGMLARLKLGIELEPVIAKIIAEKLDAEYGGGHKVVKNHDFIYHEKYRVGSSYDYRIISGPLVEKFGGIGNLEIKTVDSFVFWKKWKTDDGVVPPLSYRYQTLFQAGLLSQRNAERGTSECKFIVLAFMQNMEIDYVLYEHNAEESAWVVQQAVRFWEDVDAEREPDMTMCVDYKLYARMDSSRRTGEGKMAAEEVPSDLRELAIAAYRASKEAKATEDRRLELAAKFMQACPKEYKGVVLHEDDPLGSVTISRSATRSSSLKFNEKPKDK